MAISKPYAGQKHLNHVAIYVDRVGAGFDEGRGETFSMSAFTTDEIAVLVNALSIVAAKSGCGTVEAIKTEFAANVGQVIDIAKEIEK